MTRRAFLALLGALAAWPWFGWRADETGYWRLDVSELDVATRLAPGVALQPTATPTRTPRPGAYLPMVNR